MPDLPKSLTDLRRLARLQIPEDVLSGRGQLLADALARLTSELPEQAHLYCAESLFALGLFYWHTARPLQAAWYFRDAARQFRRADNEPLPSEVQLRVDSLIEGLTRRWGFRTSDGTWLSQINSIVEWYRSVANQAISLRRAGQTYVQISQQIEAFPELPPGHESSYLIGLLSYGTGQLAAAEAIWQTLLTETPAPEVEKRRITGGPSRGPMSPEEVRLAAGLALVNLFVDQGKPEEARAVWDGSVAALVGDRL